MHTMTLMISDLHANLAKCLAQKGLTIVHPFPVQLFNANGCPAEHQLPTFNRALTSAVVIGNTNKLWGAFVQHLAHSPHLLEHDNPLDEYVEAAVTNAVQQCCQDCQDCTLTQQQPKTQHHTGSPVDTQQALAEPQAPTAAASCSNSMPQPPAASGNSSTSSIRFEVRFSHHTEPGRFVNMMRVAQLSGLAYYSSTTHLCMHPVYGPWFALRAVVVFDVEGPDPSGFTQLPCPHPDLESEAAQQMQRLQAFGGFSNWQQHWREWAALRALGGRYTDPRYAYSPDQLEYHYTKRKEVLKRAVAAFEQEQQQQQQCQQHAG